MIDPPESARDSLLWHQQQLQAILHSLRRQRDLCTDSSAELNELSMLQRAIDRNEILLTLVRDALRRLG